MRRSRGILLHDILNIRGGAETFAVHLCRDLELDLCCGRHDHAVWPVDELRGISVHDLDIRVAALGLRTFARQRAFRQRSGFLDRYDIAVYSGCDSVEATLNHRAGFNAHYCHAPPRHYYDQYAMFERDNLADIGLPAVLLPGVRAARRSLIAILRRRYEASLRRMDLVIANSRTVQARIRAYLGMDATVIHPPCDTAAFRWIAQENFYVSTARHEPLKRIELIIDAFKQLPGKTLVVASTGTTTSRLKARAAGHSNIRFVGVLDDGALKNLIGRCLATIYVPIDEDFGISPVESMAAGKPVIGVREGGLRETVLHGETGVLLDAAPTVENLISAITDLDAKRALEMREACQARARAFDRSVFRQRMAEVLGLAGMGS